MERDPGGQAFLRLDSPVAKASRQESLSALEAAKGLLRRAADGSIGADHAAAAALDLLGTMEI